MNQVFINKEYFDIIESISLSPSYNNWGSNKPTSVNQLFQLLTSSKINSDLEKHELKKYAKKNFTQEERNSNNAFRDMKDEVFTLAIRNQRFNQIDVIEKVTDLNSFYFLNRKVDFENEEFGTAVLDNSFDGEIFLNKYLHPTFIFDGSIDSLIDKIPPSNALIIIDKYIFQEPPDVKLKSLISLIKLYKNKNLKVPFHLTIFTVFKKNNGEEDTNPHLIENAFNALIDLGNIEVQIIISKGIRDNPLKNYKDRLFYSNYAFTTIGHPFDESETTFGQNMYSINNTNQLNSSNNIMFENKLNKVKNLINDCPPKFGLIKCRFETSTFTNRIFDMLSKE